MPAEPRRASLSATRMTAYERNLSNPSTKKLEEEPQPPVRRRRRASLGAGSVLDRWPHQNQHCDIVALASRPYNNKNSSSPPQSSSSFSLGAPPPPAVSSPLIRTSIFSQKTYLPAPPFGGENEEKEEKEENQDQDPNGTHSRRNSNGPATTATTTATARNPTPTRLYQSRRPSLTTPAWPPLTPTPTSSTAPAPAATAATTTKRSMFHQKPYTVAASPPPSPPGRQPQDTRTTATMTTNDRTSTPTRSSPRTATNDHTNTPTRSPRRHSMVWPPPSSSSRSLTSRNSAATKEDEEEEQSKASSSSSPHRRRFSMGTFPRGTTTTSSSSTRRPSLTSLLRRSKSPKPGRNALVVVGGGDGGDVASEASHGSRRSRTSHTSKTKHHHHQNPPPPPSIVPAGLGRRSSSASRVLEQSSGRPTREETRIRHTDKATASKSVQSRNSSQTPPPSRRNRPRSKTPPPATARVVQSPKTTTTKTRIPVRLVPLDSSSNHHHHKPKPLVVTRPTTTTTTSTTPPRTRRSTAPTSSSGSTSGNTTNTTMATSNDTRDGSQPLSASAVQPPRASSLGRSPHADTTTTTTIASKQPGTPTRRRGSIQGRWSAALAAAAQQDADRVERTVQERTQRRHASLPRQHQQQQPASPQVPSNHKMTREDDSSSSNKGKNMEGTGRTTPTTPTRRRGSLSHVAWPPPMQNSTTTTSKTRARNEVLPVVSASVQSVASRYQTSDNKNKSVVVQSTVQLPPRQKKDPSPVVEEAPKEPSLAPNSTGDESNVGTQGKSQSSMDTTSQVPPSTPPRSPTNRSSSSQGNPVSPRRVTPTATPKSPATRNVTKRWSNRLAAVDSSTPPTPTSTTILRPISPQFSLPKPKKKELKPFVVVSTPTTVSSSPSPTNTPVDSWDSSSGGSTVLNSLRESCSSSIPPPPLEQSKANNKKPSSSGALSSSSSSSANPSCSLPAPASLKNRSGSFATQTQSPRPTNNKTRLRSSHKVPVSEEKTSPQSEEPTHLIANAETTLPKPLAAATTPTKPSMSLQPQVSPQSSSLSMNKESPSTPSTTASSTAEKEEPSPENKDDESVNNKFLLVLVSTQSLARDQLVIRQKIQTILKALQIPFQEIDGSILTNRDRRNELFRLSGLWARYPQVFVVHQTTTTEDTMDDENNTTTSFFGDWDTVEMLHENGDLRTAFQTAKPAILQVDRPQGDATPDPQKPMCGDGLLTSLPEADRSPLENHCKDDPDKKSKLLVNDTSTLTSSSTISTVEQSATSIDDEEECEDGPSKYLLVLMSSQSLSRDQLAITHKVQSIAKAHKIPLQELDGSIQSNRERRNDLFRLSGSWAKYPQFFVVEQGQTMFFGDWDTVDYLNENGTLVDSFWSASTMTSCQ